MMHPETKVFSMNIPDANDKEKMDKFQKLMDDIGNAEMEYEIKVAKELGVSSHAAMLICYLRTRSRWTQEKEDYLVQLDKEGKELPNVLAGDF